ncbi:MAG: FHA domain-containing protein [Chloroflexi bacterium]|nr:FHA domain-containing protein [Chloroflexota bacterium]
MDKLDSEDHPIPSSLKPEATIANPSPLLERLMTRRGLLAGLVVPGLVALAAGGALLRIGADDWLAPPPSLSHTLAMGPPGPDSGYGRLQLPAAPERVAEPIPAVLPTLPVELPTIPALETLIPETPELPVTLEVPTLPTALPGLPGISSTPIPEPTALPVPTPVETPEGGPKPLVLLGGLGLVALCSAAALGGGALLFVVWRRARWRASQAAEVQQVSAWLEIGDVRHPVPASGLTIGRSSDNDLHLADTLASRLHARIELKGDVFVLTDVGSANGTFVNEQRIRQQPLHDGDEIRIGSSRLRFRTVNG